MFSSHEFLALFFVAGCCCCFAEQSSSYCIVYPPGEQKLTWSEAQASCLSRGHRGLASIRLDQDWDALQLQVRNATSTLGSVGVWIGLRDLQTVQDGPDMWRWLPDNKTAEEVSILWGSGQPGNDAGRLERCGAIYVQDARVHDFHCQDSLAYACDGACDRSCDDGWVRFGGKCFRYDSTHLPFSEANAHCASLRPGATLAKIESAQEDAFVDKLLTSSGDAWIGAKADAERLGWFWTDRTRVEGFDPLGLGAMEAQAGLCVRIFMHNHTEGTWGTFSCERFRSMICAYDPFSGSGGSAAPSASPTSYPLKWRTLVKVLNETAGTIDAGQIAFNALFARCPVIRYHVQEGQAYAVYVRKTPLPVGFDAYSVFTSNWTSEVIHRSEDFELYPDYSDRGPLGDPLVCSFEYQETTVGFPGRCGPANELEHRWFSFQPGEGLEVQVQTPVTNCVSEAAGKTETSVPTVSPMIEPTASPSRSPTTSPSGPTSEPTTTPTTASPTAHDWVGFFSGGALASGGGLDSRNAIILSNLHWKRLRLAAVFATFRIASVLDTTLYCDLSGESALRFVVPRSNDGDMPENDIRMADMQKRLSLTLNAGLDPVVAGIVLPSIGQRFVPNGGIAGKLECVRADDNGVAFTANIFFPDAPLPAIVGIERGIVGEVRSESSRSKRLFLNGRTNITLYAQADWASLSSSRMKVFVGGKPCVVIGDGEKWPPEAITDVSGGDQGQSSSPWLTCETPNWTDVCGTTGGACEDWVELRVVATEEAISSKAGSITTSTVCTDCIRYVRKCVDSTYADNDVCSAYASDTIYTNQVVKEEDFSVEFLLYPQTQTNRKPEDNSSEAPPRCAFGEADDCTLCPGVENGAVCPGGYLMWPLPGWYVNVEQRSAKVPVRCAPPSEVRCVGFDFDLIDSDSFDGGDLCGVGYTDWACSACAERFYADDSQECVQCPEKSSANVDRVVIISLGFVICLAVLFCLSVAAARALKLPGEVGLRAGRDFCVYCCTTLQTVLTVSALSPPGLPSYLTRIFGALSVLQLSFKSFLHPSCSDGSLFLTQERRFVAVLTMEIVALALCVVTEFARYQGGDGVSATVCRVVPRDRALKVLSTVRNMLFILCTVLYGIATTTSLELINCRADPDRVDVQAISESNTSASSNYYLVAHPYVVCYERDHATLCLFTIGYPIWTLLYVRFILGRNERRLRSSHGCSGGGKSGQQRDGHEKEDEDIPWLESERMALKHFLESDYEPRAFWFRQLDQGLIFGIASVHAAFEDHVGDGETGGESPVEPSLQLVLVVSFVALMFFVQPFSELDKFWKAPTKALSLMCTACATWLNYFAVMAWIRPEHELFSQVVDGLSATLVALLVLLVVVLFTSYAYYLKSYARTQSQLKGWDMGYGDAGAKHPSSSNNDVVAWQRNQIYQPRSPINWAGVNRLIGALTPSRRKKQRGEAFSEIELAGRSTAELRPRLTEEMITQQREDGERHFEEKLKLQRKRTSTRKEFGQRLDAASPHGAGKASDTKRSSYLGSRSHHATSSSSATSLKRSHLSVDVNVPEEGEEAGAILSPI